MKYLTLIIMVIYLSSCSSHYVSKQRVDQFSNQKKIIEKRSRSDEASITSKNSGSHDAKNIIFKDEKIYFINDDFKMDSLAIDDLKKVTFRSTSTGLLLGAAVGATGSGIWVLKNSENDGERTLGAFLIMPAYTLLGLLGGGVVGYHDIYHFNNEIVESPNDRYDYRKQQHQESDIRW